MLKRILGDLPDWAKLANPLLKYEITRTTPEQTSRARAGRIVSWSLVLAGLVLVGYFYATNGLQRDLTMPYSLALWRWSFYPLMILQLIFSVVGLSMGVGAVNDERRRQTWDNLRSTELGAELGLRTRWISIFLRLRVLVGVILLGRVLLIIAMLYELTSFQGAYLDILANRSNPPVPVVIAVMLLAMQMTAFILMPITAGGVDIAIGLLIASWVQNRTFATIVQVIVIIIRIILTTALWVFALNIIHGQSIIVNDLTGWVLGVYSIYADWGLLLSQMTRAGELWARVPLSVFMGVVLLGATLGQVLLSNAILGFSIRIAERNE